jgi:hypothetical protein
MTRNAAPAMLAFVLLLAAGVGRAQTVSAPPPAAQPAAKPCAVTAQSRTGGAIEIMASVPGQAPGAQLVWQPVATGPGVILWITYPASAIARMDEPSGLLIRFRVPANTNLERVSVQVTARNGRAWRFDGKSIKADGADAAQVAFGLDWPYGRGLISAVAEAETLTVSVQSDEANLDKESFALSNIDARDLLLAQARAKFKALGATSCPATASP